MIGLESIVMPPLILQDSLPSHGNSLHQHQQQKPRSILVEGAIIIGAGPTGLAVAACLKERGISSIVLDKADCIASLWQHRTYDRLQIHIAKQYCELPLLPFPPGTPLYPSKNQFISYLHEYAQHFSIHPVFDRRVVSASFERNSHTCSSVCRIGESPCSEGIWRVVTADKNQVVKEEYLGRWLVAATGENAEDRIPEDLHGLSSFTGKILHSSEYRNGKSFAGKRVLVVGCGNSGMEIALDLINHEAEPSIIVRSPMHILPREMFGRSTFAIAMMLMKMLPVEWTDRFLVLYAFFALGNTSRYGILRPRKGPLEMKAKFGKTPILDMGAFEKIRDGSIKVLPAIEKIVSSGAVFVDGQQQAYDVILLATGYKSNVTSWLKDDEDQFSGDGFPKNKSWKCGRGFYVAGLSRQGILGGARDAQNIAADIAEVYNFEQKQFMKSMLT